MGKVGGGCVKVGEGVEGDVDEGGGGGIGVNEWGREVMEGGVGEVVGSDVWEKG